MKPLYTVTLDRDQISKVLADHVLSLSRSYLDSPDKLVARVNLPIQLTEVAVTVSPKREPVKLKAKAPE